MKKPHTSSFFSLPKIEVRENQEKARGGRRRKFLFPIEELALHVRFWNA